MPKYQCLHFVFLFALHLVNLAASLEEYVFTYEMNVPFQILQQSRQHLKNNRWGG